MKNIKILARLFYGFGITGIGILHFIYPGFRPVMIPIPPGATQGLNALVYLTGAFLIITGMAIAWGWHIKQVSSSLGMVLLLFVLLGHLHNRIKYHPEILGAWTDALKLLTLSGGAFLISKVFPGNNNTGFAKALSKIAPVGKYFFAFMLVVFGIDHFLYVDFVKTLIPSWIPGHVFWTYFSGIALIGSGLAIFINFKPKLISLLLGTMLLLWLILLHIPAAFRMNAAQSVNIISSFECMAFSGIAFLLYFDKEPFYKL